MSSVASGLRSRRVDAQTKAKGQRRLAGGVIWIVVVAALLAGVVAINVAVLRTNLSLDSVNRQRGQLQADIAAQEAKLASAKRTGEVVNGVPGLVQADPATTLTLTLPH